MRHSNSKNLPYYFNAAEKVSRWEPPPGTDTDKLKHYMASHHSAASTFARPQAVDVPAGKIRAAHRRLEKTPEENAKTTNLVCDLF